MSRLLVEVPGIGKLIATAIVAHMPDPGVFKSGRDFSAWLGLTPRQNSSGGKPTLGSITKKGNRYLKETLGAFGNFALKHRRQAQRPIA